jgi:peroxin-5
MLLRWLQARFPDFPVPEETQQAVSSHSTWDSHEKLTETFLALARHQYNQGVVDPETQLALGVLFYTTTDYERAKDCFESALSQRPRVSSGFCRITVTDHGHRTTCSGTDWGPLFPMGTSLRKLLGRTEKPSICALPTLGLSTTSELHVRLRQASKHIWLTSCVGLNIGAHKEAAEHFLSALVMQESTNGQTSDQLWFTLRRAFIAMVNTFIL